MLNKKLLPLSAAVIATFVALAGCSTGSSDPAGGSASAGSSTHGMDHGGTGTKSSTAPAGAAGHNDVDTMFVQGMIPHHEQAVEMSEIMLRKKDVPPAVTELAGRIKAAQAPEIDTMAGWLKDWNESATKAAGHSMDGMMGEDDLKELDAAQGTAAAELFLQQMIAHHEGAVMMAKAEISDGRNTDAVRLSNDIVSAQEAEIKEMQDLLNKL